MGSSYFVPRNVKGESRILYIFTMKSFITTLVGGIIGFGIYALIKSLISLSLIAGIGVIGAFGIIGYLIGALKIPDSPIMGVFRKAGGEDLSDILIRFFTFGKRKKVYLYNYNRKDVITKEMLADNGRRE